MCRVTFLLSGPVYEFYYLINYLLTYWWHHTGKRWVG